jgi:hypothetical protein
VRTLACLLPVLATGCSLYWTGGDDAAPGPAPDAGVHIDPSRCPPHTATIFEPADNATVPRPFTARVRWNEPGIPDRYSSMSDDFGNYFIGSGTEVVNGDGSISMPYDLPAGGSFNFEIGWFCDAGNDGPTVVLAHVRIHTAP